MRIADKMQFDQVNGNLGKNRSQMAELQNQAATQKRVTKPSDDPLAASRVLANRIDLQSNQQFTKSLNYARSFLELTDQSLGDLSEVLMRAKELAINQSNDASANEESRRVVATEVEQLYSQMISIGNRKLGDRFIFGGYRTQNAPFNVNGQYSGDHGEMNIHIDKETFLPMNVPGSRVFLGVGVDNNGMALQGAPQPRSVEELQDDLAAEAQYKQMHEEGAYEHAQAPAVRGPASMSGRVPESAGGPKGKIENPEQVQQGLNLFRVLRDLEVSLRVNDKSGVQDSLDQLDSALSQVVLSRSQVGSRGMRLDSLMQTVEKLKVDNQSAISSLEDADVFSTVSEINKAESTLQATLQTSGKLIQKSLMDFLR
ncbi:MAG: flagellar hook-associated protein FlgL [Bdellovibrionales bacterium]